MCVHVLECQWKTGFSFGVKARTGRAAMLLSLAVGAQRTQLPMIHSDPGLDSQDAALANRVTFGRSVQRCQNTMCCQKLRHYFPFYKAEPSSDYKNGSGLKFKRTCGKNLVDCHSVGTKMS